MFCLGCGSDVPKANDRRALDTPDAEDVTVVWSYLIFENPTGIEFHNIDANATGKQAYM